MFLIKIIEKNKSKKLTQWDADRYIEITAPEGVEVSHVDFAYEHDPKAIRRETSLSDGIMTAKVPNSLLQRCGKMRVWLVCDDVTVFGDIFVVAQKAKDEGYVLPDDEDDVYNYTNLEKRIADIEKNGTGGEIAEETDPTVPAWAKQPTKPSYTAEEVGALAKNTKIPTKLSDLENDLELEVEGTVEITDGEPTKESTVLTVNPNAEVANLYTAEEIDAKLQNLPSGGSDLDVQINGKSIVENGVVNIPLASKDVFGVAKIYPSGDKNAPGVGISGNNILTIVQATNANIDGRVSQKTIASGNIDYAVKCAMTDGKGAEWTDAERLSALLRLGCTVDDDGFVKWTAKGE